MSESLAFIAAAAVIGLIIGFAIRHLTGSKRNEQLLEEAAATLEQARKEAEALEKEAKLAAQEELLKAKADLERKMEERQKEVLALEKRLAQREETFDRKLEQIDRREREYNKKEQKIERIRQNLEQLEEKAQEAADEAVSRLQQVAGMTAEEARSELKERLVGDARSEALAAVREIEAEAKNEANNKAYQIVADAIQRTASDYVAEHTVSVVDLPNDEMKGRIIGREGRNIRAIEAATGVDLIIDDTPNALILSSFDPVKREVARRTLDRLIHDGRIHPGRIEETVNKVTKEINTQLREDGEKACFELGLDGVHPEIVKLLGRLRYRTSYSQNVLQHSIEVGFLCGMMASELGQNVKMARRAGLLHDIGKAIDQTMEGTHTQIGLEIGRRFHEPKVVLNAIASHHEDVPAESVIAVLVAAADALSASRPGARREMLQNYVNRMEKLEEIGTSFKGVERAFAIQAGREVRVMVSPESIPDHEAFFLAKDIARKIEGELAFPGEIKVTVIRETRVTDVAR